MKLDVEIIGNTKTIKSSTWYNLDGEIVGSDLVNNTVKASILTPNQTKNAKIAYTLPGDQMDNDFKCGRIKAKLRADSIQTRLNAQTMFYDNSLYATYTMIKTDLSTPKHKITINDNGGNSINSNTTIEGYEGDEIMLDVPTREGYIFAGYTLSGGGEISFKHGTVDSDQGQNANSEVLQENGEEYTHYTASGVKRNAGYRYPYFNISDVYNFTPGMQYTLTYTTRVTELTNAYYISYRHASYYNDYSVVTADYRNTSYPTHDVTKHLNWETKSRTRVINKEMTHPNGYIVQCAPLFQVYFSIDHAVEGEDNTYSCGFDMKNVSVVEEGTNKVVFSSLRYTFAGEDATLTANWIPAATPTTSTVSDTYELDQPNETFRNLSIINNLDIAPIDINKNKRYL